MSSEVCGPRNAGEQWQHKWRARGEGPTGGLGGQSTRAERARNMFFIFVTLDVSKLTFWLNFVAPCRVERPEGTWVSGGS